MSADGGTLLLDRHRSLVKALETFSEKLADARSPSEAELRQELKVIAAHGPTVLDVLLDLFPHLPAALHRVCIYCLACLGQEPILPGLLELVRDERVPDESRWELVQAMVDLGFDLTSEDLSQHFQDFGESGEGVQDIEEMLESIATDRHALGHWLAQLQSMRLEIRSSLIEDLGKTGERALPVLSHLLDTQDPEIHEPIVQALRGISSPRSVSLLRRARAEAPDLRHSQRAYDAERALIEAGVEAPEAGDPQGPIPQTAFGKCIVTFVDASGSRSLVVTRQHQLTGESIDCLYLLCNAERGIKDCVGQSDISPDDHEETLPTLVGTLGGSEVPIAYIRALLGDALHASRQAKVAVSYPYAAWKDPILGGVQPEATPYTPDLTEVQPDPEQLKDPVALEQTAELFDHAPFTGWLLDRADIFAVLVETGQIASAPARLRQAGPIAAGLKDLLIRRVLEPRLSILARSLELNADLYELLGHKDLARQCLLVRLALLGGDRDLMGCLGFLRRLFDQSIEHVLQETRDDVPPALPIT